MKLLYAPWREDYAKKTDEKRDTSNEAPTPCAFCISKTQKPTEANLLLGHFTHNFIIMNKYPYNAGHILIIPYAHVPDLTALSHEALTEYIILTKMTTEILTTVLHNHGTNIGINIGKAAGAGIPDHLHLHVLPRWNGDTNFLPTLSHTKQISIDMIKMYHQLQPHFTTLKI